MLKKELDRIVGNQMAISLYRQGIANLEEAGIINLLRAFGRPSITPKSTQEDLAREGARSAGWQDCLDLLVNFNEYLLNKYTPTKELPKPMYGAAKVLLDTGAIDEEEYARITGSKSAAAVRSKPSNT